MPYDILQWPGTVYPGELVEFSDAQPEIDVVLAAMRTEGPAPAGYKVKNLGKSKGYLWQLNLKVDRRQIRILYAPYGMTIVLFHIHKKSSPQEQQHAYQRAVARKKSFDAERR